MVEQVLDDGIEPNIPSSSTSSSQSSRRFHLDENSDQSILVYKLRAGYEFSSQKELCRELDKGTEPFPQLMRKNWCTPRADASSVTMSTDSTGSAISPQISADLSSSSSYTDPRWRCSRKPIGRGTSRVDIKTIDLWSDEERHAYHRYPNATNRLASVGLPRRVYWSRMILGHFQNLYILSPESSPSNSAGPSPTDGRSPNDSGKNTADSSPEGPTPSNTFNET